MWVVELEGGTLTSSAGSMCSLPVRLSVSSDAGGVERGGSWMTVVGTLLGPEGTGPPGVASAAGGGVGLLVGRSFWCRTARCAGGWRCRVGGHLPYFENCTVDASI